VKNSFNESHILEKEVEDLADYELKIQAHSQQKDS
jgi:hypothetical protein